MARNQACPHRSRGISRFKRGGPLRSAHKLALAATAANFFFSFFQRPNRPRQDWSHRRTSSWSRGRSGGGHGCRSLSNLAQPSITGCVQSANGTNSLTDNEKQSHIHTRNQRRVQAGRTSQAVRKEKKDKDGHLSFRVKKVKRDYGPCQQ